jgi:hypothetical protein
MTAEDRLKALRDKLFLACQDYDGVGHDHAHQVMCGHVEDAARPPGTAKQSRSGRQSCATSGTAFAAKVFHYCLRATVAIAVSRAPCGFRHGACHMM